jgi:hypothetical protein
MTKVKKYKSQRGTIGIVLFEDDRGALIEWELGKVRSWYSRVDIADNFTEFKEPRRIRRYIHNEPDSDDTLVVSRFEDYWDREYIAQFDIILTDGKVTGVELVK